MSLLSLLPAKRSYARFMLVLVVGFGLSAMLSLGVGAVRIPPLQTAAVVARCVLRLAQAPGQPSPPYTPTETIVVSIRLPRVILSSLVGASLSVSGVVYQGLLGNPLADPYVIGASAGASLGATCALFLPVSLRLLGLGKVPLFAFAGSLGAVAMVYRLARTHGRTPVLSLVLAGIAVGSVLSALVSLLMFLAPREGTYGLVFWLMGGFSGRRWDYVLMVLPYFVVGLGSVLFYSRELDAMLLGEEAALNLGVEVQRITGVLVVAASLLTASAVAAAGIIGFVGLVVPHVMRMLVGPRHGRLVPAACVAGAIALMMADTIARTAIPPRELPVGVVTALVGGPFFVHLLRRHGARSW